MGLKIKTTGFDDLLDGSANIKMLVVGAPGIGKTRSASFWPDPFFIDCEKGRGSLVDRGVHYVEVKNSKDMLSALEFLKSLEHTPKHERRYKTVVVDTLDTFQRSVKDEWLQLNNKDVFNGYDAWGWVNNRIGATLIRLLNLDFNVIINCHYKDKHYKDPDGNEFREFILQLQGDFKDSIFNDFDLVGFMGKFFVSDPQTKEKVERRGITFQPTQEKPFLKDRFAITPQWLPINFETTDYTQFTEAFAAKADALPESTEVGEVPAYTPTLTPHVVAPGTGGPVPPRPAKEMPLSSLTKPELLDKAKELGVTVKGNALKAEIIAAIEQAQSGQPSDATHPTGRTEGDDTGGNPEQPAAAPDQAPAPAIQETSSEQDATEATEPTPLETADQEPDPESGSPTEEHDAAVEQVKTELAATVIEDKPAEQPQSPPQSSSNGSTAGVCDHCGKSLAGENQDYVQLAYIKTRAAGQAQRLCNSDYKVWLAEQKAAR